MLARTPVFTLVIIFTLAVGVGANTAMFSVVNAVLLQGLPFRDADRIVDINEVEMRDRERGAIAPANFLDWRAQATVVRHDERLFGEERQRRHRPAASRSGCVGAFTSTTFFDVLGVPPVLGRTFLPSEAEPGQATSVVLSYGLWQRRFAGAADVIGQTDADQRRDLHDRRRDAGDA